MPESTPPPRIVRHPELVSGEPLPLLSSGRTKLAWAFVPVPIVFVIGLLLGGQNWTMGMAVLGIWLAYAALVWADGRAHLCATDDQLEVRNVWRTHQVQGRDVQRVIHQFNGKRPDFQLQTASGRVWVPASRLERGHSTLFTWLDMYAPQAVLDRQSTYWRQVLLDDERI